MNVHAVPTRVGRNVKPYPVYPRVKTWIEWKRQMETASALAHEAVFMGEADKAGFWARTAAHAAFYI